MLRKGFTLIELLIVITIIAILAGAAIPYVQDYVEDARLTKARADLAELRNAIIRYETETGQLFTSFGTTWQAALVGPYLQQALTDPWGSPYYLTHDGSKVFSAAEDRDIDTNIVALDTRPAMTHTRAFWIDVDQNGAANAGDHIDIKFTRPVGTVGAIAAYVLAGGGAWGGAEVPAAHPVKDARWVRITLAGAATLVPGRDSITATVAVTDNASNNDVGFAAVPTDQTCRPVPVIIKPAQ